MKWNISKGHRELRDENLQSFHNNYFNIITKYQYALPHYKKDKVTELFDIWKNMYIEIVEQYFYTFSPDIKFVDSNFKTESHEHLELTATHIRPIDMNVLWFSDIKETTKISQWSRYYTVKNFDRLVFIVGFIVNINESYDEDCSNIELKFTTPNVISIQNLSVPVVMKKKLVPLEDVLVIQPGYEGTINIRSCIKSGFKMIPVGFVVGLTDHLQRTMEELSWYQ